MNPVLFFFVQCQVGKVHKLLWLRDIDWVQILRDTTSVVLDLLQVATRSVQLTYLSLVLGAKKRLLSLATVADPGTMPRGPCPPTGL